MFFVFVAYKFNRMSDSMIKHKKRDDYIKIEKKREREMYIKKNKNETLTIFKKTKKKI